MSRYQITVVAMCFVLNMCDGIDVLVVSFSSSDIIAEWMLSRTAMGYVFSAGLLGMALGCFLIAPIADRVGRKNVFVASLFLMVCSVGLIVICDTYYQMLVLRFCTGLGIGGILPALAATAAEFSNRKYRDFNVGLVQAGWPLGAILTGLFCSYAVPEFGWRIAFVFAGVISLVMLLGVAIFMTNSLAFLLVRQPKHALRKVNELLSRMGLMAINSLPGKQAMAREGSVLSIFSGIYLTDTIKLWVAAFFAFVTLYTLMSWVPNIALESGMVFQAATYVGIALNVGAAIGTTLVGYFGGTLGLKKTVTSFMICAFLVMVFYGWFHPPTILVFAVIFLIGFFVQGGFNGLYPTLSRVYPAEIRATGVGFAVGIGRLGAILGPTLFGLLSDMGMGISLLFGIFSIPLLITGICVRNLTSENLKLTAGSP